MSADRILASLERVRKTGADRWVACCPAHKDRTASLSVRELDDGRVLVHCFALCPVQMVLGSIGLSMSDLFPPKALQPGAGHAAERRPYSARDVLNALHVELGIAWVVLSDVASGRALSTRDRLRASAARDRCQALMQELRGA